MPMGVLIKSLEDEKKRSEAGAGAERGVIPSARSWASAARDGRTDRKRGNRKQVGTATATMWRCQSRRSEQQRSRKRGEPGSQRDAGGERRPRRASSANDRCAAASALHQARPCEFLSAVLDVPRSL